MDHPDPKADHSPTLHPARVWAIAMGGALLATLAAWGVEEASLNYYGAQMTAEAAPDDYRPDLRMKQAEEGTLGTPAQGAAPPVPQGGARGKLSPYGASRALHAFQEDSTAKAVALSGGVVGGMFGLALGLALGFSGKTRGRSWILGIGGSILAAGVCGAAGWEATRRLVPIFYQVRASNPGGAMAVASLLLIRGIPRLIAGLAGGLALGVAAGGGSARMSRGAMGGLIGAAVGVGLMVIGDEAIALLASSNEIATSPILRSPLRRVLAILAVTVPSAACAAWAVVSLGRRAEPTAVA